MTVRQTEHDNRAAIRKKIAALSFIRGPEAS